VEEDWRNRPRSQMIERVILAVDCAKGEAEAGGEPGLRDEDFVRRCDEELFPFLNAEYERAVREEE
jgi:hypothetical protein